MREPVLGGVREFQQRCQCPWHVQGKRGSQHASSAVRKGGINRNVIWVVRRDCARPCRPMNSAFFVVLFVLIVGLHNDAIGGHERRSDKDTGQKQGLLLGAIYKIQARGNDGVLVVGKEKTWWDSDLLQRERWQHVGCKRKTGPNPTSRFDHLVTGRTEPLYSYMERDYKRSRAGGDGKQDLNIFRMCWEIK